jgi:hypothetical protein
MNERQKQEKIQSVDLDSIADNVQAACLGVLDVLQEILPIIKKNLENSEINDYIKQELARRIVDGLEDVDLDK